MVFADRAAAGRALAARLVGIGLPAGSVLVLALPRGGVPVAVPIAVALDAELDVVVARKVAAPGRPELGLGAVTATGPPVFDAGMLARLRLRPEDLVARVEAERAEVRRRQARYRGDRPHPLVAGRAVVVVDDGLATGGTARAALRAVRALAPARLVFATPVAAADRAALLDAEGDADDLVVVRRVDDLVAVGRWYGDFTQVTDDEVVVLLARR